MSLISAALNLVCNSNPKRLHRVEVKVDPLNDYTVESVRLVSSGDRQHSREIGDLLEEDTIAELSMRAHDQINGQEGDEAQEAEERFDVEEAADIDEEEWARLTMEASTLGLGPEGEEEPIQAEAA